MHWLKERTEPENLKVLRILNGRMNLNEESFAKYLNSEKGYTGERKFDQFIKGNLTGDWIVLADLLLEYEHSRFQLDSILLSQYHLYNFEIKYYEGDYVLDGKGFLTASGKEIKNPLIQLEKNESLLRQLIQSSVIPNLNIHSFLVFNHPEFTLYQTPIGLRQIVSPTQLNRLSNKLNTQPTNINQKHFKVAEQLLSHQFAAEPRQYVPEYDYKSLKKGVKCCRCQNGVVSFLKNTRNTFLTCDSCGIKEKVDNAILRNIADIKVLFPEKVITTRLVYDWCGGVISDRSIQRVLNKHFMLVGKTNQTHYVEFSK